MSIKDLKEDLKSYRKCIKNYQYDIGYDIEYFVQHSINLFEDFEKRIKKLEQVQTYYPTEKEMKNIKIRGID